MSTECYELKVWTVGGEQEAMNTLHFKVDNGGSTNTLDIGKVLIQIFEDNWLDLFLALLPSQYSVVRLIARRVLPVASAEAKRWYNRAIKNGLLGTTAAPGNVCPAVRLVPAMGGTAINRFFIPAVASTMLIDNAIQATLQTNLDTLIGAMQAGASDSGMTASLSVYSKKNGNQVDVASWNFSGVVGFQRRRIIPL
jgi:hypothetical protein